MVKRLAQPLVPSHLDPTAHPNHLTTALYRLTPLRRTPQCVSCSKTLPSSHSSSHRPRLSWHTALTSLLQPALRTAPTSTHLPTPTSMRSQSPPSITPWKPLGVETTPLAFLRLPLVLCGTQMHWTTTPPTPHHRLARARMSVSQPWVSPTQLLFCLLIFWLAPFTQLCRSIGNLQIVGYDAGLQASLRGR